MTEALRPEERHDIEDTALLSPDTICRLLVWISSSFCSTQLQLTSVGVLGVKHLLKLLLGSKSANFVEMPA